MEVMTAAFWLDRIAFFLMLCNMVGGVYCGVWLPVVTTLLATSTLLCFISYMEQVFHKTATQQMVQGDVEANLDGNKNFKESNRLLLNTKAIMEEILEKVKNVKCNELSELVCKGRDIFHEEVRKLETEFDEEVKQKLKKKEEKLQDKLKKEKKILKDKYNDDRRKWDEERTTLIDKYEEMRWK